MTFNLVLQFLTVKLKLLIRQIEMKHCFIKTVRKYQSVLQTQGLILMLLQVRSPFFFYFV